MIGNFNQAISDANKAIQLNPNFAKAYHNRGVTYAMMDNFNQAISDANKAIQLNPNYNAAYQFRERCYRALGK